MWKNKVEEKGMKGMNVNEIREKSRSVIGSYCKSCPICNGKACSNKIPGPGG